MTSQTARRPRDQRPTRSPRKYTRQTAHVEARRDGKPLIFGWGGHLSRNEKTRLQRRIIWVLTSIVGLLIVAVIIGFWVNINVIVPGLPITTVNGQAIPQSDYRKLFALDAQLEANHIYGPNGLNAQRDTLSRQVADQQKIIDDTNKQLKALPAGPGKGRTDLEGKLATAQTTHDKLNTQYQELAQVTIPQEMQRFTQSQYGNESIGWLQDDVFIRQWLAKQNSAVQARIEPTSSAIDRAINNFTANLPKASNYDRFLSDNRLSNDDVRAMMVLKLRRDTMQSYLSAQIMPPLYQVHARAMTFSTQKDANDTLKQLKNGGDFAKLATKSVDANTNTKGGDLGWLAKSQYAQTIASNTSAIVDNWIFDLARKPNELSSVLTENGAYHIVQILQIDPARSIDATTLSSLQSNALASWLLSEKAKLGLTTIASDQNKLLDPMNIPTTSPALPASPPSPPGAGGPSGVPGGGVPGGAPSGP